MGQIVVRNITTSYGELIIGSFEEGLCLCDWRYRKARTTIDNRLTRIFNAEMVEGNDPLLDQTEVELNEYFNRQRHSFSLPLRFGGTAFQEQVWQQLLKIPYGRTTTYGAIARDLDFVNGSRPVAGSVGANAISILVPCHRVIGQNKKLTGYAGGLPVKKKLLILEQERLF
ncbi:MAG: methylated-DNA--[protein]-cysteine S-methyltransferase [Desulfobulbaceae bacterium]|nr:MAG: methylated-DNA--[protein]-cysteine S-methyltransferase [Desulfobulbaceae bacterium]